MTASASNLMYRRVSLPAQVKNVCSRARDSPIVYLVPLVTSDRSPSVGNPPRAAAITKSLLKSLQ